jgi:putative acetyltransferase
MTAIFRPETAAEFPAIRRVVQDAFGQPVEAELIEDLRNEGYVRLAMVAEIDGQIVGHVLYSDLPIVMADGVVPAIALAPMAVAPAWQRQGIGSQLIRHSLDACRAAGHRIVVVLGHPEYYPRFGFSPSLAEPLESPYAGPAFMALELVPGALDGVRGRVEYAPPFARF